MNIYKFDGLWSSEYDAPESYDLDLSSASTIEEAKALIIKEFEKSAIGGYCDSVVFNVTENGKFVFSGIVDCGVEFSSSKKDTSY